MKATKIASVLLITSLVLIALSCANPASSSTTNPASTTVATPTFSPAAGAYYATQSVSISCSTSGATIYYTTDGTTPTTTSSVLASGNAITVSASETIKAIATASSMNNSAVGSSAYTIGLLANQISIIAGASTFAGGNVDGTYTTAKFNQPEGIISDGSYLYIADNQNYTIRRVEISSGKTITIAGSGSLAQSDGTGLGASFLSPHGLAISPDKSTLFVADYSKVRMIVLSSGVVSTVATVTCDSIATDGTYLYVTDSTNNKLRKVNISTGVVTALTVNSLLTISNPRGIVISTDLNTLYFSNGNTQIYAYSIASGGIAGTEIISSASSTNSLEIAYDGTYIYANSGNHIYKFSASLGSNATPVIYNAGSSTGVYSFYAICYASGGIFIDDLLSNNIYGMILP